MKYKIKKGDQVQIMAGKDSGKSGRVLKIQRDTGRVIIEGLNMVKKAQKPKAQGEKGSIVEIEAAIDLSNVQVLCKKCGPTRIGIKVDGDSKVRVCKKCGGSVIMANTPRLKTVYTDKIAQELFSEFGYKSKMQIPKIEKIVVSMGVGEAIANKKLLEAAVEELTLITGQKVMKTKARKSIANFKVREGQEIGAKVTLRGNQMYEFLDRLINISLPRVKDFRGVSNKAFDGRGNYSLGITEQIIFPEIDYDKIEQINGLNVAIVTTAKTNDEARSLLAKFGMPFQK